MNYLKLVSVTAIFLAVATLNASPFVRPYAAYVHPSADGYSDAGALGVAIGTQTGTRNQHEFSFDWAYTKYNAEVRVGAYSATGTEKYMPYLASYRYLFGAKDAKARFYAGPSLGYTNLLVTASIAGPGVALSGASSSWAFTAAGSTGVLVALTDRIALDVGYRFTRIGSADVKVARATFELGDVNVHAAYAGVSFRF
jgi:opacity protein-like surface antigen